MSSRLSASLSGTAGQTRRTMRRHSGLPFMSEQQAQAYLIARDALRRIRRTSSLVLSPQDRAAKTRSSVW
jgi:hypothetical protein